MRLLLNGIVIIIIRVQANIRERRYSEEIPLYIRAHEKGYSAPTTYNLWNKMDTPHDKLDKLDKLAHHGVIDDPSYYACIQEQFAFFSKVVDKVEELFQKYHRVIITGDHGSSRLAARFFHAREGYPAPASSQVCSHGRFCIFNGAKIIASSNQVVAKDSDGNQYLIFKNYDHFKQSGFAAGGDDENAQYGELHGGASPEELLVPVVVFDSIHELPLTATWKKDSIKFSMKKAKPVILFNKPVQNVQASLGSVDGICTPIDTVGKEWMIVFSENKAEVFGESATLDRFHGFIPGWEIPRMTTGMIAKGWAINTEYFAEVMHALRDDLTYSAVVDAMIDFPSNADKRHMTAIKRLCTAFLKLLFPHVQTPNDIDRQEFIDYCLNPAIEMRSAIYKQLCIIDAKEYDVPSKRIPEIVCK